MRNLGLNRMRTKADLIEANGLTPDLAEEVFSRVHPIAHREDGEPLYLEKAVDRAINMVVERGQSSTQLNESIFESEPFTRLANRLCEFLEKMTKDQGPKESPEFVRPNEAAKRMRKNVQTIMRWCRDGEIDAVKVNRQWLIPIAEVDRVLQRNRLINGKQKGGA